ncbi:ribosome small subunit-stimulated gtpase engc [hydrocarbon metagenome]|uniref:Ribosome small subunit-stimulated gtpase engc n=1 Tax=hydrocarbon metagenome TaxID=938273 RepID=A0A0W8E5V1_9ZZZZ
MTANQMKGIIIKKIAGFYYVKNNEDGSIYECKLRGKLKQQVLTGDKVVITILDNDRGIMEEVLPRENELYRPKIANVTAVILVFAHDRPAPTPMLLDRLLFLSYYNRLLPIIVLNKCDIPESEKAKQIKAYYPMAGFNFILSSAKTRCGIQEILDAVKGEVAVMAGPSGSGKSTLLNALSEGLKIRTQEVSSKIGRGKHTTRHVELFPLPTGGYIADTPGFSIVDMPSITRREVALHYPDFDQYTDLCEFRDCLHYKERTCGVKQAHEEGRIPDFRYNNYISMLEEVISSERCYK